MADIPVSGSPVRMGRPPLGNKPTQVRIPDEAMARIDALYGRNRRAVFIREAIEEKLKRAESAAEDDE